MEGWKTYTPDGRMLEVQHDAVEWVALCEGVRGVGQTAREAIIAAVGSTQASIGTREPTIEAWVAAHAAQLESEAG